MSFLAGILAQLVEWLLSKIGGWLASIWARFQKDKQIDQQTEASAQPLKDAQTGAEIDAATDDIFRHI